MAKKLNPYLKHIDNYKDSSKAVFSLTRSIGLRKDQVDPIYITTDGKIVANGFIDKNDNIEFFIDENSNVSYLKKISESTQEKFNIKPSLEYLKTGSSFRILNGDFNYFSKPITYYDNRETEKYEHLNKTTKKLISSKGSDPFVFTFTHENGAKYPVPHIKSTWFPSYNYDLYLSASDLLNNVNDLIVIKSGEYRQEPRSDMYALIGQLSYSSGTTGNIYIDTLSVPVHKMSNYPVLNTELKSVKIPRHTNSDYGVATPSKVPNAGGTIGIFKNGVYAFGYKSSNQWTGAGTYTENSYEANKNSKDTCGGFKSETSDIVSGGSTGVYHYKSAPVCLYDTGVTTHSPLLGYAFDGNPIYGPYGYSVALNSGSAPKLMTPSWRLKQVSSRTNGPDYDATYPSGYFVEDYEYVSGLGDLDRYNGRTCITPEYPGGVYAYFTTVDSSHEPAFPYIIGDQFYGKVEQQNWTGVTVNEPASIVTGKNSLGATNFDVDLFSENVFGIKYTKRGGLLKETVIWVSPHELKSFTGICLNTGTHQYLGNTGQNASFSGNLFTADGNQIASGHTNKYIAEKRSFSYPSSKDYTFVGKQPFSGGHTYIRTDSDTLTQQQVTGYTDLGTTDFYTIYSGYKNGIEGIKSGAKNPNFETGVWDGVIPSGVPFKIEVWSFNGGLCGFENEVSIFPVQNHDAVYNKSLLFQSEFTGIGPSDREALDDLTASAKNFFLKEIDSYLVSSGIKEPSASLRKYTRMITNRTRL